MTSASVAKRLAANYGDNAAYYLARLDRDDEPMAARVRAGDLTANAAVEKGWRKPRATSMAPSRKSAAGRQDASHADFLEEVLKPSATPGACGHGRC